MRQYKKYTFWRDAIEFTIEVYNLTKEFPKHEVFGLASQMQRAASSIPSNIAEGAGRNTDADFAHFLDTAMGSAFEVDTQLLLSYRLNYITEEQFNKASAEIDSIQKRMYQFMQKLRG